MTHVLLVCPHNRLEPGTIQAIFTQSYTGSIDHAFTRHNPEAIPGLNIIAAYQRLAAQFLAGPYSDLFIVENDILPPPDALDKLLAAGGDINYGCYTFRRGTPVVNVMRTQTTDPMTGDSRAWRKAFTAGAVVECTGLGFGCTLIKRHVLEQIPLRSAGGGGDADTCLALDAAKAGMTQRADLSVVCGHIKPDGETLWPTGEKPFYRKAGVSVPKLARITALESFGIWDELGVPTLVEKGATASIDAEIAASMSARGQLEIVK